MKQAITIEPKRIQIEEVPIPAISATQVLLEMQYVGICGSDVHIYNGQHPAVPLSAYPVVQGHEGLGKIVKMGSEVQGYEIGDRVVVEPLIYCGGCYNCSIGNYHLCDSLKIMGLHQHGMLREYFAIDSRCLCKVNGFANPGTALIEALASTVRAVRRTDDIIGKNIIIIGAGAIGNMLAQVARAYGAHTIAIIDVLDEKLSIAKKMNIVDFAWNSSHINIQKELAKVYGSQGADCIFECVGAEESIESTLQLSRRGAEIVVLGVFAKQSTITSALFQNKELHVKGSRIYKREDFLAAIDLVKNKQVDLDVLVHSTVTLDEYPNVYEYIDTHKETVLKVLVKISG